MPPEYFHSRLTWQEAGDYMAGVNRRYRHTYEAARMVHGVVGGLFAKNYKVPELPWDKEVKRNAYKPPTPEELAQYQADGAAFAASLNAQKRDS